MTKNLWEQERKSLLYSKTKEYEEEGYDHSEARTLAKKEVNEVMEEKEDFVSKLWDNSYEED
tara:strand:+ start:234 stop:419 length:186 start_codon:yes stop_codon:yes gene_type:complete